jgi:4a-hydroxytetrahydrobiopterin dehydratase
MRCRRHRSLQAASTVSVRSSGRLVAPRPKCKAGDVSELATAHCEACEPGTPPLPEREAAELSAQVPEWERDGTRALRREFSFPNFRDAFGFVARVALIAEAEGHHPDIELGWGRAAFELTTHAASGLTRNDFVLAAKIDQLAG